jgi:hypothetical protein
VNVRSRPQEPPFAAVLRFFLKPAIQDPWRAGECVAKFGSGPAQHAGRTIQASVAA